MRYIRPFDIYQTIRYTTPREVFWCFEGVQKGTSDVIWGGGHAETIDSNQRSGNDPTLMHIFFVHYFSEIWHIFMKRCEYMYL